MEELPFQTESYRILTNIASSIFEELKKIKFPTDKHKYLLDKDPKFITNYPTVCKYMMEDLFDMDAFVYLLKYKQQLHRENITSHNNDANINVENYYKANAEYVRQMYAIKRLLNYKQLREIYDENYNWLKKEYTGAVEEKKKNEFYISKDRKKNLIDYLKKEYSSIYSVYKEKRRVS